MSAVHQDNRRKDDKRVVLVTGFGPFKGHPTNASWEAVKELRNLSIEKDFNVTLVTEEIPVVYQTVSTVIPKLWSQHDPMLVVHVGVSAQAKCLTIESQAHGNGYVRLDVEEKKCQIKMDDLLNSNCELNGTAIETGIDVLKICDGINRCESQCKAIVSKNAGRYLCEYIYHKSLSINPEKTIFVHVPDIQIYSAAKTAEGLYQAIKFALEFIQKSE